MENFSEGLLLIYMATQLVLGSTLTALLVVYGGYGIKKIIKYTLLFVFNK